MITGANERQSLWTLLRSSSSPGQFLANDKVQVLLSDLNQGSAFAGYGEPVAGKCVMIAAREQALPALALMELDGLARRLVLCPPDFPLASIPRAVQDAEADLIVTDDEDADFGTGSLPVLRLRPELQPGKVDRTSRLDTEWVLFTSGTTGNPKMAVHTLPGLTGAIQRTAVPVPPPVWATFYDMRRYGGLQIFLRAMLGGCSFVMSASGEPLNDHLERLRNYEVTNISGTPSHWRRVLMSPNGSAIAPRYVRLSGEIADQSVLDGLRALYPNAHIVHAYASTEAGVGFEVHDAKAGFPASFIGERENGVTMAVKDGSLHLRSTRTALRYLSNAARELMGADGFVDTGDLVELRGDRYYFVGRRDGIINVGGQKVHPEEVEDVINRHDAVRMSLVRAQKSAILGALVTADVVLREGRAEGDRAALDLIQQQIREICARQLDRHKVPAVIKFVPSLTMTAGGKLARNNNA